MSTQFSTVDGSPGIPFERARPQQRLGRRQFVTDDLKFVLWQLAPKVVGAVSCAALARSGRSGVGASLLCPWMGALIDLQKLSPLDFGVDLRR